MCPSYGDSVNKWRGGYDSPRANILVSKQSYIFRVMDTNILFGNAADVSFLAKNVPHILKVSLSTEEF